MDFARLGLFGSILFILAVVGAWQLLVRLWAAKHRNSNFAQAVNQAY